MNNCHTTTSFKIPLKGCRDSIIDHNLVTIQLSVEWAPKAGDEPNLIINITNKTPAAPHIASISSSVHVDSLHHQTPSTSYQQSNISTTQPTTVPALGRGIDQTDQSSSSSTTTTAVIYNTQPIPRQRTQSPVAIQQIKADLQAVVSTFQESQQNFMYQNVIHTPPNSIEDRQYDMNASLIQPTFGQKPMSAVISPCYDLQTSPTQSHNSQRTFLLCNCPNPTNHHLPNCPINSINQSEFHSNQLQFLSPNATPQYKLFPSLPNLTNTLDSSSITTIVSQQPSYSNNYSQSALNVSHDFKNNQSNFKNNLPMSMIPFEQVEKKSKIQPLRRRNSKKIEPKQSETPNRFSDQQISSRKSSVSNPPSLLSTSTVIQTATVPLCDNFQKTDSSKNDIQSPQTTSNIRSPVELDIPLTESIDQVKLTNDAVDQIIDGVVHGQGIIIVEEQPTKRFSSLSQHHHQLNPMKSTLSIRDSEKTMKRIRSNSTEKSNHKHITNSSSNTQQQSSITTDFDPNESVFDSIIQAPSTVEVLQPEYSHTTNLEDILSDRHDESFNVLTPLPLPLSLSHNSSDSIQNEETFNQNVAENYIEYLNSPNKSAIYDSFLLPPSISTWETNEIVSSTISTASNSQENHVISTQHYSQTEIYTETNRQTQTFEELSTETISSMNTNVNIRQTTKSSKILKAKTRVNAKKTQMKCTRCGRTSLIDITSHEFPKKKGLIFECTGCGNNSIQSNISSEERRQRLAKVAADHLNIVSCQFCQRICHSHHDYITHLKDDHQSNKPLKK